VTKSTDVPHKGCLGFLNANHDPMPKLIGARYEMEQGSNPRYSAASEKGSTAANCIGGMAGGYPCQNVDLLSLLDNSDLATNLPQSSVALNDIWGWTHSGSGREFALVGTVLGTVFVEITDPYNPIHLGALPSSSPFQSNDWRDVKTYGNYAFIVAEVGSHGVQVFDLTRLLTASPNTAFTEDTRYSGNGHGSSHNIFVNEDSGFAYSVGTSTCGGGLHIIDVRNPMSPSFSACYSSDGYTHDVQCVNYKGPDSQYTGQEICFASNEDTITILDVTDKSNIIQLARESYSQSGYTHQGWLTEDQAYFIFDDETDEYFNIASKTRTHVMDVSSLQNPTYAGFHNGRTEAIDHNLYIVGDFVYQANYRAGLNILKISDLSNAQFDEEGFFDLYPTSDSNRFNGAWSNYPFFPSGTIIMSGVEQGLFVLKYNSSPPPSPTPPPTSAPNSSPTPPPTSAPNSSPTPPPTSAPNPNPTPSPTVDDDDNDDIECADDPAFFFEKKNGRRKYCRWFEKKKIRCYRKPGALDACPEACGICDASNTEVCTDSRMKRKACKATSFCFWDRSARPKACAVN